MRNQLSSSRSTVKVSDAVPASDAFTGTPVSRSPYFRAISLPSR